MRLLAHVRPLTVLLALACSGCGEPQVGGGGSLSVVAPGAAGEHLTLRGTPYEQGWWHGHLLRERIQSLHERWQRRAFAADGDLASAPSQARRQAALLLVDPVLALLPESLRQEFEGLAAGSGLPLRTLLLSELLTDVLRFLESPPRLLSGRVGLGAGGAPSCVWDAASWGGLPFTELLWVTRPAVGGQPAVSVLTWPGGLGGLLAVRGDGAAVFAVERERVREREGLKGVPFRLSLRLALEAPVAAAGDVWPRLARTTGHEALVWIASEPQPQARLLSRVDDEPLELGPLPALDGWRAWLERAPGVVHVHWREGTAGAERAFAVP